MPLVPLVPLVPLGSTGATGAIGATGATGAIGATGAVVPVPSPIAGYQDSGATMEGGGEQKWGGGPVGTESP